jgi:hypothetical protein
MGFAGRNCLTIALKTPSDLRGSSVALSAGLIREARRGPAFDRHKRETIRVDISTEELLTFSDAAKRLPRRRLGKRPHVATLHRWATGGVRGIRLDYVVVGTQRCTSMPALQRFIDALTDLDRGDAVAGDPAPEDREPAKPSRSRQQAVDQAKRRLARAG